MMQDLRDAFRALRRAPAFSVVAVLTLALAIGSTTTVFSVVDAILVRGLPYADVGRLHAVYEQHESGALRLTSYPTFLDWQKQSSEAKDAIEGMAFVRGDGVMVPGKDGPERRVVAYVSPGFFDLLGAKPLLGRLFLAEEERLGARVAVISHDYFMRHYGGDHSIVGKTVSIDSVATTVIGVMPRGFAYPNFGSGGWLPATLWQPIAVFQATHNSLSLRGLHVDSRTILRLRAGADSARAATAMRTIEQRLAEAYPVEQGHWTRVQLSPLSTEMFGELPSTLALITGAIGLVLLLACANVANLMLVRSSVRARELAVRAALGAGTWRIARHLLAEAGVLAILAGGSGLALATGLVSFLRPYANARLPFAADVAIDVRAMLVAVGLSAITAFLIGALPAFHAGRGRLVERLRGGASSDAGGVAQRRARNTLVAVQFALAITVLIGSGLLIQSVRRVGSVPLGFNTNGVVSLAVSPSRAKYGAPEQAAALYSRIMNALRAIPSVETVAAAGGALLPTKVETQDRQGSNTAIEALYHPISADYLKTLRIPIVAGRGFTEDDMRAPNGFLITENLAKRLWPNGSALGQRITVRRSSQARADFGQPITLPIVGVVADYRQVGPEAAAPSQVFLPYTLEVWPWMTFVVRSPRAATILTAVTDAVKGVEPAIEFFGKPSVAESGLASLGDPRIFVTSLLSAFAATALLLAAVGLYGIVAYGVAQRTRELGIRIAVGATKQKILRLVMWQAAKLVIAGVVTGLVAATAATKALQALLFETSTTDVATFVLVPVVLAAVATIASLLPAYRATRTDPLVVIRAE